MKPVPILFAGFWALIFVTGVANPGYKHYRDHVSLLAADGSKLIWVTVLAILLTAAAQWVAAYTFWPVNRAVAVLLLVAGLALVFVAFFRVPCPERARFCPYVVDNTPAETVHNIGVITYAVVTMAAMITLGIVAITKGHHSLVGVPGIVASVVFALTFSGLLLFPEGLAQRTWIAVGQIWLVVAVYEAQSHRSRIQASRVGR
ncbi:MAG: DUF998 domain-containing protein [Candidatus Nanopelagicales bacterium]|nr:DUF998 domain-containing protein [Candidatus Nanopelagicales bacterium]